MRRVTQQEAEMWRTLAQQHGFGSAEGRFVLGRFIVEDRDENGLVKATWRRTKRCRRELVCERGLTGTHLA